MAEGTGRPAVARAFVASFQRLAWLVLQRAGGAARPAVGEIGRRMILRSLLAAHASELRLFGRLADRPGFVAKLAGALDELRAQCLRPEDLEAQRAALEAAGRGDGVLAAKLHDLARLARAYEAYLAGRFSEPAERLGVLAERLRASGYADGARVWVDGFSGFTPQELAVLRALAERAEEVVVTLCVDPDEAAAVLGGGSGNPGAAAHPGAALDPGAPFHPTLDTLARLVKMAAEARVPVAPPVRLPGAAAAPAAPPRFGSPAPPAPLRLRDPAPAAPPRFRNPALRHLEAEWFRYPGARWDGAVEGIVVASAASRRAEVDAAAREILRLVREEGWRFRDVAVIVRDLDAYHDLILSSFTAHGIPVFIDHRRPVPHHPLVELLRAAVETVLRDWREEPLFRYLKTDLVPVARSDVDLLENYVLEFGIRGRRMYEGADWTFARRYTLEEDEEPAGRAERLAAVNRARRRAAEALLRFDRAVAAGRARAVPARELARALFALLEDLGVPERIREWSEEAEAAGALDRAQEHLQVWNGVVELLDQVAETLPDLELTLADFLKVLEAGLDGLKVGLIPPGLDQVIVGTVERSRHPDVRGAFVLGATEQAFPRRAEEDVIFSDREREILAAGGCELGPTGRLRAQHEQYLTYIALTRASERLWVSYPLADEEGRAQAASPVVRRLRALFPRLEVEELPDADDDPLEAATPAQLAAALVRRLGRARDTGRPDAEALAVRRWLRRRPELEAEVRPALAALADRNAAPPLPEPLAAALYGETLTASVSRLEAFARCPFQHFARYGLGLQPRRRFRVEAPDLGQLYHAALSRLARRLRERGWDWADLAPPAAAELVNEVVDELAPRLQNEILASSARYRHVERVVRRTLESVAAQLGEHARRGRFRPWDVEVGFGPEEGARLPGLEVPLRGGRRAVLRGRIDRIDVAETERGRRFLRVVDYKASGRKLDAAEVYHGLALQLGLYMLVAERAKDRIFAEAAGDAGGAGGGAAAAPEPAGLLYLTVDDPIIDVDGPLPPEEAAAARRRARRAEGWVLGEVEALLAMDAAGAGELVPAKLTTKGAIAKSTSVIDRRQMAALFRHLERRVQALAQALAEGRVEVAPYQLDRLTPCGMCEFRPVCRFDPSAGHLHRRLAKLSPKEAWRRIELESGAPGGEGAES
ncbi:MAG: exodeoxyribonuclease V subunit gamma [Firmicutes bacterium]|nr:exodeoxyribonuclease V subunit gamma [Bacillota bacterium]